MNLHRVFSTLYACTFPGLLLGVCEAACTAANTWRVRFYQWAWVAIVRVHMVCLKCKLQFFQSYPPVNCAAVVCGAGLVDSVALLATAADWGD